MRYFREPLSLISLIDLFVISLSICHINKLVVVVVVVVVAECACKVSTFNKIACVKASWRLVTGTEKRSVQRSVVVVVVVVVVNSAVSCPSQCSELRAQ